MSFWIAGTIVVAAVGTTLQAKSEQKKARKQAKKDTLEEAAQARKAEVFAETEGEGIGNLGKISLEVDDEEEDEEISTGHIRI